MVIPVSDQSEHVSRYLRLRRARDAMFPQGIFSDPAWDIMLDIYLHHKRNQSVTVSDACIASSVPTTTARRWIGHLVRLGILIRTDDEQDRRRSHLTLPVQTERSIESWCILTFGDPQPRAHSLTEAASRWGCS